MAGRLRQPREARASALPPPGAPRKRLRSAQGSSPVAEQEPAREEPVQDSKQATVSAIRQKPAGNQPAAGSTDAERGSNSAPHLKVVWPGVHGELCALRPDAATLLHAEIFAMTQRIPGVGWRCQCGLRFTHRQKAAACVLQHAVAEAQARLRAATHDLTNAPAGKWLGVDEPCPACHDQTGG